MRFISALLAVLAVREAYSQGGFFSKFVPNVPIPKDVIPKDVIPKDVIPESVSNLLDPTWIQYTAEQGKTYLDKAEETLRNAIFKQNLDGINEHNLKFKDGTELFEMGLNQFADLTHTEFLDTIMFKNKSYPKPITEERSPSYASPGNVQVPDEKDWRKEGVVTEVKNQGNCASCWAFTTTGTIEGLHAIKTGELISLSEQNLLDCSRPYGPQGCDGGWMEDALAYVKKNDGIDTEESYPYEGNETTCRYKVEDRGTTVQGHKFVPQGNEELLKEVVGTIGPVAIAFDASDPSFQFYSKGIYRLPTCRTDEPSHAALIVGYGRENGHDYWLLKNSWGTKWGDDGYFKLARNMDNHCGIASWATFPEL